MIFFISYLFFSFIYNDFGLPGIGLPDMYTALATFDPSLPPPISGSYTYDLVIDTVNHPGYYFKDVELDVDHAGTGQEVTKTITEKGTISPILNTLKSVDGLPDGPDIIPGKLTSITVTDSWNLDPVNGRVESISNTFTQVPAPLPLLGVGAVFGSIRKLRSFSSQLKTFSMG